MKRILTACAMLALASCSPPGPAATSTSTTAETSTATTSAPSLNFPAGSYTTDKAHSVAYFHVNHLGFSHYTGNFTGIDAQLTLDPAHPEAATVTATIDTRTLSLPNPPAGFLTEIRDSATWLNAKQFPQMTFHSTAVSVTGANTADVTGDFTFRGQTHPVTLHVTLNGGYPGMSMDPHARVGFSATGSFKRSDFGMSTGVPPAGSNMGVGDEVEIAIETEMSGPAFVAPAGAQ